MKRAILFVLLSAAAMGVANAATIQLIQGGWTAGGPLTVTFTGTDANGDSGYETSELTSFDASFLLSGGGTALFSLPDLGLDGFFYRSPVDYFILASNPDWNLYEIADATTSIAILSDSFSVVALSGDRLSPVPEPSSMVLLGIPISLALAFRRKQIKERP